MGDGKRCSILPILGGLALIGSVIAAVATRNPAWIGIGLVALLFVAPLCLSCRSCDNCGRPLPDRESTDCPHCGGSRRTMTRD